MECTFDELGDVLKVGLDGRLVAACVEEVREQVTKRMERFDNLLFNLEKMSHIDSSGLGLLVQFLQRANMKGGTAKLAVLQPHPRIVFDITKVSRVFEIHDSVEAALASFGTK